MISGQVIQKHLDRAVISVGGLGLEFFATPHTLSQLPLNENSTVHTYLVVREDALTLYGFATAAERETFATLIQVKGIGPKLALAALSVMDPADLVQALAQRDLAALQRIPGVGKKSAERMLIEIGDKLGTGSLSGLTTDLPTGFDATSVIEALINLGWNQETARQAVSSITATDTSTALREALQYLGRKQ